MPSHRRYMGASRRSRFVRSPDRADVSHRDPSPASADVSRPYPSSAMRISPTDLRSHRRPKRSSSASSSSATPTPYPSWVILNRMGARRDSFHGDGGDGTTSAASRTSGGEEIRVSFDLAKPPRTSLLVVLDWTQGPRPSEGTTSYPHVIAAHRSAVLLEVISPAKYPRQRAVDLFVYDADASEGGHPASLTRLPVCYWKGTSNADSPRPRVMSRESMGLLSCDKDSFIIADLERRLQPSAVNIYLFCSVSDDWRVLRGVPIWDADDDDGVSDLGWWSTDVVLPYGRRFLTWVDCLRGMIIANMVQQPPVLRYVPLPVDAVLGNPYHSDYGRGCPEATRSLCATNYGIKFVDVSKHGNITLFSLLENQTWTEDATMDFAQLWSLDPEDRIPHVKPEFPVVDMGHPHVVCFLLNKDRHFAEPEATTWMIKVHMKKKILLDIAGYSNKVGCSSSYQKTYRTARMMSGGFSFISTEMPYYLSAKTMERRVISKLGI